MNRIFILSFLLFCAHASALEVTNFKSGQMCGINKNEMGWVCFEKEEIYVTGQSSCQSQGKELKCTWYGFSFDYSDAKKGQEINCEFSQSKPTYEINLTSANDTPSTTSVYTFVLAEREGAFINPQYSVLGTSGSEKPLRIVTKAECSSEGEKVFEYKFIAIYPPNT